MTRKELKQLIRETLNEVAPVGWEGTVKKMKKHKEIDNPYALSNSMKNKGDNPHYTELGAKKKKYYEKSGPKKHHKVTDRGGLKRIKESVGHDCYCTGCRECQGICMNEGNILCNQCRNTYCSHCNKIHRLRCSKLMEWGVTMAGQAEHDAKKEKETCGLCGEKSNRVVKCDECHKAVCPDCCEDCDCKNDDCSCEGDCTSVICKKCENDGLCNSCAREAHKKNKHAMIHERRNIIRR